ncbi:hypothetical protein V8C35DRAFT_295712 [Trichoderma chlorosporum]
MYPIRAAASTILNNDDEWRGTTDPTLRRRVQNRLNQRAYRQRRMLELSDKRPKKVTTKAAAKCLNQLGPSRPGLVCVGDKSLSYQRQSEDTSCVTGRLQARDRRFNDTHRNTLNTRSSPTPWYTDPAMVVAQFQELALGRHVGLSPSNDHLLCIMQFNVMRAFGTLSSILGLSPDSLVDVNALSPFTPSIISSAHTVPHHQLPKSLAPTALQKSIPHHPWFDILPFPQMRDNLLRLEYETTTAMEKHGYDADRLCHWMVGLDNSQRESGLILWGDPWNLDSWEVTTEFLHEWGWTLEGCVDLFRSTNYWRTRRGEKPLFRAANWGFANLQSAPFV